MDRFGLVFAHCIRGCIAIGMVFMGVFQFGDESTGFAYMCGFTSVSIGKSVLLASPFCFTDVSSPPSPLPSANVRPLLFLLLSITNHFCGDNRMSIVLCSFVLLLLFARLGMLEIPTATQVEKITDAFAKDLASFSYVEPSTGVIHPVVCSVCDGTPSVPNWYEWVDLPLFSKLCHGCNLHRDNVSVGGSGELEVYPRALLDQYKVDRVELEDYVLSPKTLINSNDEVMVCRECARCMRDAVNSGARKRDRRPPTKAIASGRLIGDAPTELTDLNSTELAMVSAGRISCQSYIYFGGHQQIRGWHTIFKNQPGENVASLELLEGTGLKGTIVVVLCGPFTSTQKALLRKRSQIRPEFVIRAFGWLKANNYLYRNIHIPTPEEIPLPVIYEECL